MLKISLAGHFNRQNLQHAYRHFGGVNDGNVLMMQKGAMSARRNDARQYRSFDCDFDFADDSYRLSRANGDHSALAAGTHSIFYHASCRPPVFVGTCNSLMLDAGGRGSESSMDLSAKTNTRGLRKKHSHLRYFDISRWRFQYLN